MEKIYISFVYKSVEQCKCTETDMFNKPSDKIKFDNEGKYLSYIISEYILNKFTGIDPKIKEDLNYAKDKNSYHGNKIGDYSVDIKLTILEDLKTEDFDINDIIEYLQNKLSSDDRTKEHFDTINSQSVTTF